MKDVKISVTIKPTLTDHSVLTEILDAGADIIRIPFWPSAEEQIVKNIGLIRTYDAQRGKVSKVLIDLPGNKIRFGTFAQDPAFFIPSREYSFFEGVVTGDNSMLPVDYPGFSQLPEVGDQLVCGDGEAVFFVTGRGDGYVTMMPESRASIYSKKGIAITGKEQHLQNRDLALLDYGIAFASRHGIEWLALSFTSRAEEIDYIRNQLVASGNSTTQVMSKIESRSGMDNLDSIISASDGIMVARGDLASYMDYSVMGVLQKMIVESCADARRFCLVSTGMMMSIMEKARPRAAEIMDLTQAVIDGADGVQFCEETAHGHNPAYVIKTAKKIIHAATMHESIRDYYAAKRRFRSLITTT